MKNRKSIVYKVLHKGHVMLNNLENSISLPYLQKWYKTTDYPEEVRKLKNIHKGERCFIIGNGPSLTASDLEMLKGEKTFSCNKIYKAFGDTTWRPYYYMVDDRSFVATDYENILRTYPKIIFDEQG